MTAIADLPDIRPSLLLDFANSGRVDPRIECARASSATCWGPDGKLRIVPANVPRIDYDPATGKCLGLLVEEARTNLRTNSVHPRPSIGTARGTRATTAPDGLEVVEIVESNGSSGVAGEHYLADHVYSMFTAGKPITQSIYVKKLFNGSTRQVSLRVAASGTNSGAVRFDFTDDTCKVGIAPTGWEVGATKCSGGWWRVWAAWTPNTSGTNAVIRVQLIDGTTAIYLGDAGEGMFFYGHQVEEGAFPTSYIPTESSAVTRAADNLRMSIAENSLGTLGVEGVLLSGVLNSPHPNVRRFATLDDGTLSNRVSLRYRHSPSDQALSVVKDSAGQADITVPTTTPKFKLAGSFSKDKFSFASSGVAGPADSSGEIPPFNRLKIGASAADSETANAHIERIYAYSRPLTEQQLQRLTA